MKQKKRIHRLICVGLILSIYTYSQNTEKPPGVVINHISAKTGIYIGSPSLCVLPNGDYIACHDEFGPKSSEFKSAKTIIFASKDKGETWANIATLNGQFWSNLFVHNGELFIMGTNKHHGNFIIRKSTDDGKTWTTPYDSKNGLILEGEYHTAPVPMVVHKGRLWRAVEYATAKTTKWPERYSAVMLSAPVGSNIINRKNWTRSNDVHFDATYLGGKFKGWLEGNAVVDKNGNMINMLRVHVPFASDEYVAIINISKKGKKVTFNPKNFFKMPGASKKFTIRYDDKTKKYWSIINYIPEEYRNKANPDRIRNFVSIATSNNLHDWTVNSILISHPNHKKHGFQYIDWLIEGDDIIYVSRTAFDDAGGGASDYHNANYMTFHRIINFRSLAEETLK